MKIFIENIPPSTTEDEIKQLFSSYGIVESVHIVRDELSSTPETAYVLMPTVDEGELAISSLNGSSFKDVLIKVREADDNDSLSDDIW